jgi:hypothetical protein
VTFQTDTIIEEYLVHLVYMRPPFTNWWGFLLLGRLALLIGLQGCKDGEKHLVLRRGVGEMELSNW